MSFCYTVEDDKSESQTRVNEVEGSESLSFSQLPAIEPNSTITVSIRPKVSLNLYCSHISSTWELNANFCALKKIRPLSLLKLFESFKMSTHMIGQHLGDEIPFIRINLDKPDPQ